MNPLAEELNHIIKEKSPSIFSMLSSLGKEAFFPKGILSQSAEAKEKAYKFNATIGIATENNKPMFINSVASAINGIDTADYLTYASSYGIPELRQRWRELLFNKNSSLFGKNISLPVATAGVTNGLSIFADMFIDKKDVIIMPSMNWGNYNMIFSVRKGANISLYDLFSDNKGFNIKGFEKKIKEEAAKNNKITVILNFPHNPTGYSVSDKEADAIVDILYKTAESGTNVIALIDDAYFGLVYEEGILKESLFARLSGLHKNILAVKADGATKEEFVWGLRVGFVTYGCKELDDDYSELYEALEKKTAGSIRGAISNASHLSQRLVLNLLNSPTHAAEKEEKFNILKKRALKIKEVLKSSRYSKKFEAFPFNSGYFMCIKLKSDITAESLRQALLSKYGVGLIAVGEKNLRVAFSSINEEDIPELFDIILKCINEF
ncbi:MAG: aminotransferase class I/II-fold pyridoxal phosphate-dependent enzyme [Deltaproteobacteria bacterium]|nr:aminotransferase class I/II-fold pyridoxal phosphate-dependent enzyme [Deltaproteobacteria bacterium]